MRDRRFQLLALRPRAGNLHSESREFAPERGRRAEQVLDPFQLHQSPRSPEDDLRCGAVVQGRRVAGRDGHSCINHSRRAMDNSICHRLRDGDDRICAPGGEVDWGEAPRFQNPAMQMPDDLGLRGCAREPADRPSSEVEVDDRKPLAAQAAPELPGSHGISRPAPPVKGSSPPRRPAAAHPPEVPPQPETWRGSGSVLESRPCASAHTMRAIPVPSCCAVPRICKTSWSILYSDRGFVR